MAAALVLVALAVRSVFFKHETGDYTTYFHAWYEFILDHGRFGALKYSFSNYNEPYLYLSCCVAGPGWRAPSSGWPFRSSSRSFSFSPYFSFCYFGGGCHGVPCLWSLLYLCW